MPFLQAGGLTVHVDLSGPADALNALLEAFAAEPVRSAR